MTIMTASAMKSLTSVEFEGGKQKHRSQQREQLEDRQRQRQLQIQHQHQRREQQESIARERTYVAVLDKIQTSLGAVFPVATTTAGRTGVGAKTTTTTAYAPASSSTGSGKPPFLVPVLNRVSRNKRAGAPSRAEEGIQVLSEEKEDLEKEEEAGKRVNPNPNPYSTYKITSEKYTNDQLGNLYPFNYSLIPNPDVSGVGIGVSIGHGPTAGPGLGHGSGRTRSVPFSFAYDLEISPTIDASSCSSSSAVAAAGALFYTVPKPKPKSTSLDLLGTPSILKSFRQLQEPTRFNTSKHSHSPGGSKLYVPPQNRVPQRKRLVPESETTTVSTTASLRSGGASGGEQTSGRSDSRRTTYSEASTVQDNKPLSIESPRMPLRVRMRRDEYYYTDSCSKATQTDTKELSDGRRKSSCASSNTSVTTTHSGRRVEKTDKIDRSTSPISQVSSAQYLQKLKDLEKITGHFVIQRFFTRTDQDFTIWLEEQLSQKAEQSTKSNSPPPASINNIPENPHDPSDETDSVPLQDASENPPDPTNPNLADQPVEEVELELEATEHVDNETTIDKPDEAPDEEEEEDVIIDETVEVVEVEEPPEIESTESPRISDVRRPSEIDQIPDILDDVATTCLEEIEEEGAAASIPEETEPEPEPEPQPQSTPQEVEELKSQEQDAEAAETAEVQIDEEALIAIESQIIAVKFNSNTTADMDDGEEASTEPSPPLDTEPLPSESAEVEETTDCEPTIIEIEDIQVESAFDFEDKFETETSGAHDNHNNNRNNALISSKFLSETETESTPKSEKSRIKNRKKIKHSKSFPSQSYYLTGIPLKVDATTTTVLSIESQETEQQPCQDFPSFVFPHPNLQIMRKSNSLDSCLGTDFSSIKTRNDSGNSNSGRGDGPNENDNNLVAEEGPEGEPPGDGVEDSKVSIEEEIVSNSNKDSGLDGYSGRSNWFGSTDMSSSRQDPEHGHQEDIIITMERATETSAQRQSANSRDVFSADSDSESEVVMSENYHARSEAETDTEITTDGDAVADDDHKCASGGRGSGGGRGSQGADQDQTDVDEDVDDKDVIDIDNDLLARMELDELRLEIDKSSAHSRSHSHSHSNNSHHSHHSHGFGCRNTCTQTNRSLFSSAWSNATSSSSATTNTSSTGGSYIDLEVISKKFPVTPSAVGEGGKRNYLPSSSSCLNFVNCNMNFSVRADESKFKMSVSLPAVRNRGERLQLGGRPTIASRKLQILQAKNLSDKEKDQPSKQQRDRDRDRDLPSLWAHVRNRLDSKVSLDVPGSTTSELAVRGDGIGGVGGVALGVVGGAGPSKNSLGSLRDASHASRGHLPYGNKSRGERGLFPSNHRPQHNPQQHHFLQTKTHTNDDRIKRSLERLSKLLDIDKS